MEAAQHNSNLWFFAKLPSGNVKIQDFLFHYENNVCHIYLTCR